MLPKTPQANPLEHSALSRHGLGKNGRVSIYIYRPHNEDCWSCVIFDGDLLVDVCNNAFATDIQAAFIANLRLAKKKLLFEDERYQGYRKKA